MKTGFYWYRSGFLLLSKQILLVLKRVFTAVKTGIYSAGEVYLKSVSSLT